MFLTDDELKELTGYVRRSDQRKWLTRRGWLFETAASGKPIIGRAYADQKLGKGMEIAGKPIIKHPNVAALKRRA